MKRIIWIMLMAISSGVIFSKDISVKAAESDIIADFKARLSSEYGKMFGTINPRIKNNLEKLLTIQESFDYSFDSLAQYVKIVQSKDKNLRIFSWNKMSGGTAHDISVTAQYMTSKGEVKVKRILTDAVMQEIHELDINGRRNYLCIGYGTYGGGRHHKAVFLYEIDGSDLKLNKESFDKKYSIIQAPRSRKIDFEYNENEKTLRFSQMSYEATEDGRENVVYKRTILKLINGKFTETR